MTQPSTPSPDAAGPTPTDELPKCSRCGGPMFRASSGAYRGLIACAAFCDQFGPISPLSSSGRTPEPSEVRRTTERAKLETMIRYPKIRSLVDAAIWGNGSRKDLLDALHTIRRELP